jgi:hypothetical protein
MDDDDTSRDKPQITMDGGRALGWDYLLMPPTRSRRFYFLFGLFDCSLLFKSELWADLCILIPWFPRL